MNLDLFQQQMLARGSMGGSKPVGQSPALDDAAGVSARKEISLWEPAITAEASIRAFAIARHFERSRDAVSLRGFRRAFAGARHKT